MRILVLGRLFFIALIATATAAYGQQKLNSLQDLNGNAFSYESIERDSWWNVANKRGGEAAKRIWIPAYFFLPAGSGQSRPQKRPAVVIVHGVGGLYKADNSKRVYWDYAKKLADNGIAALIIDVHGARSQGRLSVADSGKVDISSFVADSIFAAEMLRNHPAIDPERIGVLGFSKGGQAALLAIDQRYIDAYSKSAFPFKAAAAVYPGCNVVIEHPHVSRNSSVLLLFPKLETVSNERTCRSVVENLSKAGVQVHFEVYQGARHAWDEDIPATAISDRVSLNCEWKQGDDGQVRTSDYKVIVARKERLAEPNTIWWETYQRACLQPVTAIYEGNSALRERSLQEVVEFFREAL